MLSWAGARILKGLARGEASGRMETGLLTLTHHGLRGLSAVGCVCVCVCVTEQRWKLLGALATWRGPSPASHAHPLPGCPASLASQPSRHSTQKPCSSPFSREAGEKGIEGPPKPKVTQVAQVTQVAGVDHRSAPSFLHNAFIKSKD